MVNTDNLISIYSLDFEAPAGDMNHAIEGSAYRGAGRTVYSSSDPDKRDWVFNKIMVALANGAKMVDIQEIEGDYGEGFKTAIGCLR